MRLIASALVLLSAASLTACSGGHHASPHASGAAAVTRWWNDGGQAVGSTIDPSNPTAAAKALHPSRQVYCDMLRQTIKAGHSILPGVSASSPALLTSTEAFLAELQSVAPPEVSGSWRVLGATVVELVKSGGKSAASLNAAQISSAAATVSNDAKSRCGVSLAAS